MFESHGPDRKKAKFFQLAQQEADEITPLFSEALHCRIMHAVDSAHPPMTIKRATQRRSIAPLLGLAAVLSMVVLPAVLQRVGSVKPLAVDSVPAAPIFTASSDSEMPVFAIDQAAHQVNRHVQDVVQTAMVEQQWAGLDHDVRLAARYLADQVPLRSAWATDAESR